MKKLLILMLVLGLASSASALVVTLDPSGDQPLGAGSYDVYVVSDEDTTGYELYLALVDSTYGSITSVVALSNAGSDALVTPYGDMAGFFNVYAVKAVDMSPPFDTVLMGNQFLAVINYTGAAVGEDLPFVLLDGDLNVLDSTTFQIPEPMTIALLGLGSLFLLRRRK